MPLHIDFYKCRRWHILAGEIQGGGGDLDVAGALAIVLLRKGWLRLLKASSRGGEQVLGKGSRARRIACGLSVYGQVLNSPLLGGALEELDISWIRFEGSHM